MNLMGYLVTIANIQSFSGTGGPLQDISVRVSEVHRLAEELKSEPAFPIDAFMKTGFYRVGNEGKYLSKNLRDYMYTGDVNPTDEGVILTLYFAKRENNYYEDTEGTNGAATYYLPKKPAYEEDYGTDDDLRERKKRSMIST